MAFNIYWSFLPQLVYFFLTLVLDKPALSRMSRHVYFGLPAFFLVSALSACLYASLFSDEDLSGMYLALSLAMIGGICLANGTVLACLSRALRKTRAKEKGDA
nr:hypothetical protein [Chromobacterium sp. ASV5]